MFKSWSEQLRIPVEIDVLHEWAFPGNVLDLTNAPTPGLHDHVVHLPRLLGLVLNAEAGGNEFRGIGLA